VVYVCGQRCNRLGSVTYQLSGRACFQILSQVSTQAMATMAL
jgi:hypothetical protein